MKNRTVEVMQEVVLIAIQVLAEAVAAILLICLIGVCIAIKATA